MNDIDDIIRHKGGCTPSHLNIYLLEVRKMPELILTQAILKDVIHYDPQTGIFTWKKRDRSYFKSERSYKSLNTRMAGKQAKFKSYGGYIAGCLFGRYYLFHVLAFLYMNGEFAKNDVDHINGDGTDNRWVNLRDVTHSENLRNAKRSKANTSGQTGVSWSKKMNKWGARIRFDKKQNHLGFFVEFSDAVSARKKAEMEHNYHENHGRN